MRRYLSADERGSIVSVSDSSGDALAVNAYDEYGVPAFGALPNQRFGYAGAMWLQRAGLHQPTLRAYAQHLGRFDQTDPLLYGGDGPNLYAYVGNDPVNWVDPLGLQGTEGQVHPKCIGVDVCIVVPKPFDWLLQGLRGPSVVFGITDAVGGGGGAGGGGGDRKVTITKSCQTVPVLQNWDVQAAALEALDLSLSGNPSGTAEWGFFVSQSIFGSNWIGPSFSGGFQAQIPGEQISRRKPSAVGSLLTGYWPTPIFIHAHPNAAPPSPVSTDDTVLAESLGATIVAIDKAGNLTCTTGK